MGYLKLQLDDYRMEYQPGETIRGTAEWQFDQPAEALEVRLFWHTSGKGTEDVEIVSSEQIRLSDRGTHKFAFVLPEGPYSFSGKLVSLSWAVELVVEPTGEVERVSPIVVSPTCREIVLCTHEGPTESV